MHGTCTTTGPNPGAQRALMNVVASVSTALWVLLKQEETSTHVIAKQVYR
jgi:hypothetical protein